VFICELEKMGLAADLAEALPCSGWPFSGTAKRRCWRSRAARTPEEFRQRAGCEIISKQNQNWELQLSVDEKSGAGHYCKT
jgi:hypothetical protein